MNDSCWKVDTGHKSGYLTYVEKKMAIKLPYADLKADPHIKSKVKILKKQLSYILEIMQNGSGFGCDDEKKMVTGDRETYMGWAKDVAEDEPTKDGEHTIELGEEDVSEAHDNANNTSGGHKNGRKRTYADLDTLGMGFVNVSNSFAKFLEAEQQNTNTMNGIHKALQRESDVHDKASENRDKFLEVLQDLPGLTDKEVVMAIRVIGPDAGRIDFFLKMRAQFKVEFVRQELEAAKKKQLLI
ncbi:hypothetical protein BRADI_1g31109v3 [Brachypodium distachyon]|uniref:Uncharacterized protein n=1 Tax=Brachypodium distachyon TaxID=15368 RepID=A0A0Q3JXU4_BRADI|nr:hypothetical protein BRADI_1g31109v3 [Brachypodium distachyon]